MRKMVLYGFVFAAVMGLVFTPPTTAEEPGDPLLEVFKKDIPPRESLVPAGVTITETFQPGRGDPIGKIDAIEDRVLVIHQGENTAYVLEKALPLFTEDTLITDDTSKAQIEFNDGSFITLGTYTKLVLDQSIYDPSKQDRNSFIRLLFGKARFIVKRLVDFRSSKYEVKTPTAVVGVRGSDFAVCVSYINPLQTTLATGADTTVLFAGDIGPAHIVGPGQISVARAGEAASLPLSHSGEMFHLFDSGGMPPPSPEGVSISNTTLAVLGGGVAVGAGVLYYATKDDDDTLLFPDTVAPTIREVTPTSPGNLDAVGGTVSIEFSEPMNTSVNEYAVNASGGNWTSISDGWSGNTIFQITFSSFDTTSGSMTVTLTDFKDIAGNTLGGDPTLDYTIGF